MTIDKKKREDILAELRRVRSPFKVAMALGVEVGEVWNILDENPDILVARQERYGGEGRPDLRDYIVGKKRCGTAWDNDDEGIALARANYEAGTHDMMTHRDGAYEFLVSKPQKVVTPRPDYFKPEL